MQKCEVSGNKKLPPCKGTEIRVTTQFRLYVTIQTFVGTPADALIPHLYNGRSRAASRFGMPDSKAMFGHFLCAPFHRTGALFGRYGDLLFLSSSLCKLR